VPSRPFQTEYSAVTLRAYRERSVVRFGAHRLEISSSSLSFRIGLADIDSLSPHEEVIESVVETLAKEMLEEGLVRDPLMVDQREYVILDGMHRFGALRHLKCRFVPCCLVDYDSSKIQVGSWFRLFAANDPESTAERLLRDNGIDGSIEEGEVANMTYNQSTIILTDRGSRFVLPESVEMIDRARTAVRLEKAMLKTGHSVDYQSEAVAIERLKSGSANLVISLPIFSKQQIREFGLQKRLLPHKVTRHIVPSRPLRADIPLELLRDEGRSRVESEKKVGEMLAERHVERKPPGSVVDGRRYEEELLLFSH